MKFKKIISIVLSAVLLAVCMPVLSTAQEVITPEVTMNWGAWVQTIVDFLIVAFCIFVMIKFMNNLRKRAEKAQKEEEAAAAAAPAAPTKEEELLTEIRDILKNK